MRFILEGYDGLAQASTACPKSALVTLRYHYKNRATLISILDSLEEKLVNQKSRLIK
ncbi:MAG: DUF4911 domain-containing protein [Proteobacteria bacterium]|nr:DUF4911 domain-containing protein [Pseudomonadota bacterium]MBU1686521.1 DUF4911 domain-containing protein [Pseudomonadota bacterium]